MVTQYPSYEPSTSTPPTPSTTRKVKISKNFSSPHSFDAPLRGALEGAPASPPSATTTGLGGAVAPLIEAAVGGVEQTDNPAFARLSKQPQVMNAGWHATLNQSPGAGVHVVAVANGKMKGVRGLLFNSALVSRIGALFGRTAAAPWSNSEKRLLSHLQAIPDEDLTALEFAAGQQPRPAEFSQKLKHLLSNWSTQTTLARSLMDAVHPQRAADYAEPEWFAWSKSLAYLTKNLPNFRNLTVSERTIYGLSFVELPETERTKFLMTLTPEQTQFLTQAKEAYEQWKIRNRTNRHP